MIINKKLIKIILIIFLLVLDITIFIYSSNLDCNKCVIVFKSKLIGEKWAGLGGKNITININELYDSFNKGHCTVVFNKVGGYYVK